MFNFQFLNDKIYSYMYQKKPFCAEQFGKIGVLVDFIIQKLKSKHLVCLSFLWWQVLCGNKRKYCTNIPDLSRLIAGLPWLSIICIPTSDLPMRWECYWNVCFGTVQWANFFLNGHSYFTATVHLSFFTRMFYNFQTIWSIARI